MAADRHRRLATTAAILLMSSWLNWTPSAAASMDDHSTIAAGSLLDQRRQSHSGAAIVVQPSPGGVTALIDYQPDDGDDGHLQPPHSVKVEAKTEHSFTLSWQAPSAAATAPIGYSVHCSLGEHEDGAGTATTMPTYYLNGEHVVRVKPDKLEALVAGLQSDSKYTVRVAATYRDNRSAISLPFLVSTLPIRDNTIDVRIPEGCDCHAPGTVRCAPRQQSTPPLKSMACVCHLGYGGQRCDTCVEGHYSTLGQCQSCQCSTLSSSGNCIVNAALERGRECTGCRAGHQGPDCDQCSGDYFSHGEQCLHCSCLVLCPKDKGQQHCLNCSLMLDAVTKGIETCHEFSSHVRRRQKRTVKPSDGTVAVIAVLVSLAFIATVAIALWCYGNKFRNHNQNSLWSMELHEEKISLNSSCDYQRLDAATISGGHQKPPADGAAGGDGSTAKKQQQQQSSSSSSTSRTTTAHQTNTGRTADLGNHKYHCISI